MSVPDNPFDNSTHTPLNLRITTTTSNPTSPVQSGSPPTNEANHNARTLLGPNGHGNTSGSKTPRRVQWTSDSHIVQMHQLEAPASPVSQLDESNIQQVNAALERHRSNPHPHKRPNSTLSLQSEHSGNHTDEDYDYRLDVDPPPQPLQQVGSNASGAEAEPRSLFDLLDNGVNEHISGFIPMGETDGLPNLAHTETRDDMSAAKDIVRQHTGKWGVLRRRVKGANAVNRAFRPSGLGGAPAPQMETEKRDVEKATSAQDSFAQRYPEEDHDHSPPSMNGMPALPGGASVLSSLLALYGQQQNGMNSGFSSAASSRASTEDDAEDNEERQRMLEGGKNWFHRNRTHTADTSNSDTPGEIPIHNVHRPSLVDGQIVQIPSEPVATPDEYRSRPKSPGFKDMFKKAQEQIINKERPKAARSGAGVFGALIQNTQNISGAATPAASVLAPAAHRPGYQLSRYSLPDVTNAPNSTPAHWRPSSRPSSRAASRPGSVHSSTAVEESPSTLRETRDDNEFKKTISSDDLSMLKKRNKSALKLENLKQLPGVKQSGHALREGGHAIRNAEKWILSGGKTPLTTTPPNEKYSQDGYFPGSRPLTEDERRRREWEQEKKRRKKAKEARKKQEIFIIQHVAAILCRQQFIMKLARALMMFGSPSHRLETQIQATAKVLEINAQVVYLPGTMLISFGDDATHTSETKFLKQATGLDLGKLLATHHLYWNVVHDKMSVDEASKELDVLMTTPVYYNAWQSIIIGAACSAFITVIGFYGSFIDALMAMPLGVLLVIVQMLAARNDMFSNVFEIAIATIISFIAAALASTNYFCYTALVSGGVVLILPGYIVLCGALELASRNITAGAVRIGYSVIYSLFLGFGISIGAEMYIKITGDQVVGASDYTCYATHLGKPWWGVTPSAWWYFLCAPGYSFVLSLRNQQPFFAKELPIMVIIACAGWSSNHFSAKAFPNRSDLTSAIGSFCVGTLGNLYGKLSNGSSFPVTVVGILFQLPSGLSNGGIFNFASDSTTSGSTTAYSSGFQVAQQLVSVAIGLTVGLFVSAVVTHPFGGGRRRGSGIFSF